MVKKGRQIKGKVLTRFVAFALVIVLINLVANSVYSRFDLTKEKRYTLSNATSNLIDKLDDKIFVNVHLDGDLPIPYQHLKSSVRDMLNEFRLKSGGNLDYTFEDVLADKTIDEKKNILKQFYQNGIDVEQAEVAPDETGGEKYIIPGATVFYKGNEIPLNFMKREFGKPLEEEINGSIELLEYEIGTAIRKAIAGREVKIAFADGHGELSMEETADIANELNRFYKVERLSLNLLDSNCYKLFAREVVESRNRNPSAVLVESLIKKLKTYKGLVIAKPRTRFSDIEKLVVDQYVMNGGKVIFLVESLIAEMDSVAKYGRITTANHNNNLDDLLFNYGVKIKSTLVQDLQCNGIPAINQQTNRPGFWPWWYYPLFNPADDNPITRNLESIWGQYCSTMDTTARASLKKTVLLKSSEQSRVAYNPVMISLDLLKVKADPANFNKGGQISAVLVEGEFNSPFTYRESITNSFKFDYKNNNKQNSMIVIGDGDLIRNQVSPDKKTIYPLGYDRYASQNFGEPVNFSNKKFFLNCVDYLCDESNLIEVRNKEVVLRLLDKGKAKKERFKWQMLNVAMPIAAVIIFALINLWYRKRRWA